MPNLNIGLTDEQRHGVIELLNRDLADQYPFLEGENLNGSGDRPGTETKPAVNA